MNSVMSFSMVVYKTVMNWLCFCISLEKEILDRYLDVVLKGNKDGLKVRYQSCVLEEECRQQIFMFIAYVLYGHILWFVLCCRCSWLCLIIKHLLALKIFLILLFRRQYFIYVQTFGHWYLKLLCCLRNISKCFRTFVLI